MSKYPRSYRLIKQSEFESVFAKPLKRKRKYLLALYHASGFFHARLGVIVAKHHVKRAVDRNQIKRVIRESFRQHLSALNGFDIVILVRSKCTFESKQALREDIDELFNSIN